MRPTASRAVTRAAACGTLALAVLGGCAGGLQGRGVPPPDGSLALGLAFGDARDPVERALLAGGIAARPAGDDPDAVVAARCPQAPVDGPCRLVFGPNGLYAAQIDVPSTDAEELVARVERWLGPAARGAGPSGVHVGVPRVVAAWERPGWTVAVSHVPADGAAPASAVLRVEYDEATPPVVAGVPLGRRRADVEASLQGQGATLVSRDGEATAYVGCPQGAPDAISCVVQFNQGRAAAVTELHASPAEDQVALEAWRARAERMAGEIGRAPAEACPDAGPDRVGGDCTATWASSRLLVVVGAHRGAGGRHRGAISVYTTWTYPPLAPASAAGAEEE